MALGALAIASLIGTAAKAVGGGIQGLFGAKKQKDLWANRPLLGVTEGEKANDQLYKQMASSTEMPGQRRFEEKLGETYSQGVYDTQKTATSGIGATQSAVDLASKKMAAVRDLAGQFADYKAQRMDALGRWNNEKTNLEQERFNVNELTPWGIKMNEAVDQKQQGFNAMGQGIDQGMGMLNDLAGTNAYMEIVRSLYEQDWGKTKGNQSAPLKSNYNPQQNLMNTVRSIIPKPNF